MAKKPFQETGITPRRAVDETEIGLIQIVKIASSIEGSTDLVGGVETPIVSIDSGHRFLHDGFVFTSRGWSDMPVGVVDFMFVTPDDGKNKHIAWEFSSEGEFTIDVHENVTSSANGTAEPTMNMNRDDDTIASVLLYRGPTITSTGTKLPLSTILGAGKQTTGLLNFSHGIVMRPNTKYLFRITRTVAGADPLWFNHYFQWYETPSEE